jgi:hypothetical protein
MYKNEIETVITVDRQVIPTLNFGEYGTYHVSYQHELSSKISTFVLERDVFFESFTTGSEIITAEEKLRKIQERGYIPLDMHCAFALWQNKDWLKKLMDKWWDHTRFQFEMKSVDFPGTLLADDDGRPSRNHILSIVRSDRGYHGNSVFMPFETEDEGWGAEDPSLVFNLKSEHIKRQLT